MDGEVRLDWEILFAKMQKYPFGLIRLRTVQFCVCVYALFFYFFFILLHSRLDARFILLFILLFYFAYSSALLGMTIPRLRVWPNIGELNLERLIVWTRARG